MQTSQLYEQYKAEFIKNCQQLETITPEKNQKQYQKLVKQSEMLLKHISIEMCSIGSKKSTEQLSKLQPWKKVYMKKKKQWEDKQAQGLFGDAGEEDQAGLKDMVDQNEKLSESKKLLYDMEDISNQISNNLNKQSEKIKGGIQKVKEVRGTLANANKLVDRMLSRQNRRANTIKIVVITIVLIIAGLKLCCY